MLTRGLSPELVDFVEDGDGRHEAEEGVDSDGQALLAHKDGRLVAMEDLEVHLVEPFVSDRSSIVEEARVSSNLLQVGLAECSLEDDIEEALHDRVLLVNELVIDLNFLLSSNVNDDLTVFALVLSLWEIELFVDWFQSVKELARGHVWSKTSVQEARLFGQNLVHDRGIENIFGYHSEWILVYLHVRIAQVNEELI